MKTLIPALSEKEKQEIILYFTVYEKYADDFSKKATEDLKDHPVFGTLIRSIPKEVSEANDKLSRALQKDAIINSNWQPYIEYQIEQGIVYAKMGLDFKAWYEVIAMVKNYLRPILMKEYPGSEKLLSSLNGMNRFMDIAMGIIGEAYMREKEGLIREEQDKIKKLNEELEQKVIERTSELKEFQYFFNNSNDFSCIANATGYFEILNSKFKMELGYSQDELSKNPFLDFVHPDDIPATLLEYDKLIAGATTINFLNRYRKKDGSYLLFDWNATPNPVTGKIYCIARDITVQKKAEEQLQAVNKDLESFTYSVSHDLRAPLRIVNGYAEILATEYNNTLDEEGKRLTAIIMTNAKRMGQLIDDMLNFSRLGKTELNKQQVNMNKLVAEILNEQQPSIDNSKTEIKIAELPSANCDQNLMRQVWFNLISNAIKYSSKKEKAIIEIGSLNKSNEIIFFAKDNGAGFDMRYADKLFGVFQRLHKLTEFEGTGVGLALVHRIITKHGGKVWAEAEADKGATFYFSLPA